MISFQKNVIMAMECVREKKESSIASTLCFADGVQHIHYKHIVRKLLNTLSTTNKLQSSRTK